MSNKQMAIEHHHVLQYHPLHILFFGRLQIQLNLLRDKIPHSSFRLSIHTHTLKCHFLIRWVIQVVQLEQYCNDLGVPSHCPFPYLLLYMNKNNNILALPAEDKQQNQYYWMRPNDHRV